MSDIPPNIDPMKIEYSIQLLNENVKEDCLKPLISLLEALKKDPDNKAILVQISDALNDIGVIKGAVLTYAPYVWTMLAEDPFYD